MQQTPVSERIAPVISAVAERIHYAESRRANYSTMGGVLIAAAIAIFTFAWGAIEQSMLRWAGSGGAASMFVVGAATVWLYGRQTNRYPFTTATKTWKWFYRDALPQPNDFKIPWTSYFAGPWKKVQGDVTAQYVSQLPLFESNISRISVDMIDEKQDLEQLYALHVNELYKNLYLSHIRTFFNIGLVVILISFALGGVYGWLGDLRAHTPREFRDDHPTYTSVATLRLLGSPLASEARVVMKIDLVNRSPIPMTIRSVKVYDKEGWPVPIELAKEALHVVPAKSSVQYYEFGKAPGPSIAGIRRVEVGPN